MLCYVTRNGKLSQYSCTSVLYKMVTNIKWPVAVHTQNQHTREGILPNNKEECKGRKINTKIAVLIIVLDNMSPLTIGFCEKCRFRAFMKSKPLKHGIKIMCLCHAHTH